MPYVVLECAFQEQRQPVEPILQLPLHAVDVPVHGLLPCGEVALR